MRPSERLTALVLSALALAALLGSPRAPGVALAFVALALATALLARTGPRGGVAAPVRDFLPIAVVLLTFLLLEPVILGLNPRRFDATFARLDDRWLAGLVAAWRGVLGRARAFTDATYLAYASYYALPIAVAAAGRRRGAAAFEGAVFPILLCFYASFAGYLLFPTLGPRLSPGDEARLLGGGEISDAVRAFLRVAERTRLDAFPSGHTAVALVSAAAGARLVPGRASLLFTWAGAVVFSTVYVHVHYAVDVIAGALLAVAVLACAGPLSRALGAHAPPPRRA